MPNIFFYFLHWFKPLNLWSSVTASIGNLYGDKQGEEFNFKCVDSEYLLGIRIKVGVRYIELGVMVMPIG